MFECKYKHNTESQQSQQNNIQITYHKQIQSQDYGEWLMAQYKGIFMNTLKKIRNDLRFKLSIRHMPPRWFNDCIYSLNNTNWGGETLQIEKIGNDNDHFSTFGESGNCPKPFVSFMFGDEYQSTVVTTTDLIDKDGYNYDFEYKTEYGEFVIESDIAIRTEPHLPFQCYNDTNDILN